MKYWIDLEGISLSEADEPVWLQALPLNTYTHPLHGTIDVTPERAIQFAQNVKNKVRGQDLDIDYDHKQHHGHAAGWVVDAEAKLNESDAKKNGLWIAVNFTKDAIKKLKDKEYRYFSADFLNKWTHPATQKQFNDVLCGGALTNRPFLKDILPINLSEIANNDKLKEGSSVDELKKELGLPDTATDAEVLEAVKANKAAADSKVDDKKVDDKTVVDDKKTDDAKTVDATELAEAMKKLAEENPLVQHLLSEREETSKRMVALEAANRLSEVKVQLSEIKSDKFAIAPSILEELQTLAVEAPKQFSDKAIEIVKNIVSEGIIELGERGTTHAGAGGNATEALTNAVNKVMTDKNVDYTTALSEVVALNPALFDNYNNELLNK